MTEGPVCKTCYIFKRFKDKCWYYWDNKRVCTQHRASAFSEPAFKQVNEWDLAPVIRSLDHITK